MARHGDVISNHDLGLVFQVGLEVAGECLRQPAADRAAVLQFYHSLLMSWTLFSALIIMAGFATGTVALTSVHAAQLALNKLEEDWTTLGLTSPLPRLTGGGNQIAHTHGLRLATLLPATFLAVWILASVFIGTIAAESRNSLHVMRALHTPKSASSSPVK